MEVKKYIQENEERFLDELFSLIRIPSISAQSSHKDDIWACAERWKELLLQAGAQHAEVMPSQGNPFVYAEYSPISNSHEVASNTQYPLPNNRHPTPNTQRPTSSSHRPRNGQP